MNESCVLIAQEKDIDAINQIIANHNTLSSRFFTYQYPLDAFDVVKNDKQIAFIYENCNEIYGFIKLHSNDHFSRSDAIAEFEIIVKPDSQNQSVGKTLLESAIQYTKKKTSVIQIKAKITTGNDSSKRLCEKCGFHVECVETKGFIMALDIIR
jgi:RimJ/RimL family protein N-acetyltransferase